MHCGKPLPFKATSPRAATAVVVTLSFGRRRLQGPCSTQFYGWPSQSSYPKLPSIFPRNLQRSFLPTVAHIPHAAKDDDVAVAQPAACQPHMPEKWPDFSEMKVDPDIEDRFFNRKEEYEMIMNRLEGPPKVSLLLLGPKNSGKSVSYANVS